MDQITFRRKKSSLEDYQVIDIFINGNNLIELLKEIELPFASIEGHPEMAGHYEGIPPLLSLPPHKHFWGVASVEDYQYPERQVALFENKSSGIPGEWTFTARIDVTGESVKWSDFRQQHRPKWDYSPFGTWTFDLVAYRNALRAV